MTYDGVELVTYDHITSFFFAKIAASLVIHLKNDSAAILTIRTYLFTYDQMIYILLTITSWFIVIYISWYSLKSAGDVMVYSELFKFLFWNIYSCRRNLVGTSMCRSSDSYQRQLRWFLGLFHCSRVPDSQQPLRVFWPHVSQFPGHSFVRFHRNDHDFFLFFFLFYFIFILCLGNGTTTTVFFTWLLLGLLLMTKVLYRWALLLCVWREDSWAHLCHGTGERLWRGTRSY